MGSRPLPAQPIFSPGDAQNLIFTQGTLSYQDHPALVGPESWDRWPSFIIFRAHTYWCSREGKHCSQDDIGQQRSRVCLSCSWVSFRKPHTRRHISTWGWNLRLPTQDYPFLRVQDPSKKPLMPKEEGL